MPIPILTADCGDRTAATSAMTGSITSPRPRVSAAGGSDARLLCQVCRKGDCAFCETRMGSPGKGPGGRRPPTACMTASSTTARARRPSSCRRSAENAELRRANEILRTASASPAAELGPRRARGERVQIESEKMILTIGGGLDDSTLASGLGNRGASCRRFNRDEHDFRGL